MTRNTLSNYVSAGVGALIQKLSWYLVFVRLLFSLVSSFDHLTKQTHIQKHYSTAKENIMIPIFRRIGQGFCGTVWAAPTASGDTSAIKREDGGPGRSLQNDYDIHSQILVSLSDRSLKILVPACHEYVSGHNHEWWDEQVSKFPEEFQVPCNALVSERIPAFPKEVRETIVKEYCPDSLRLKIESIMWFEPNQDCMIRPYLERRRRLEKQSRYKSFSLRNYPLHVDQIEELGLDGKLYARVMAETLAHLYWKANVDANDIEFVLAPPRKDYIDQLDAHPDHPSRINSDTLGEHVVWILDFDCCRRLTLDEKGVKQAVAAFYRNDPYYPRPGRDNDMDQALWKEFKERFLESSESILGQGSLEACLPVLWVDMVEQRSQ